MIERLFVYESDGFDPYRNLAIEEYLLTTLPENAAVLYLWQNEKTVVIGRNQVARRECDVAALSKDGGRLSRRLSGGGAVYHDLGNLNFTFLLHHADYDAARQCGVLKAAVRAFGIDAALSGRNDLTVSGQKFSGNAYYRQGDRRYHHGTLMIDVDLSPLERYLLVSDDKLKSKGVASVRSRVVNLKSLCDDVTVSRMKDSLKAAFAAEYRLPCAALEGIDEGEIARLTEKYASEEWLFGREMPYDFAMERRFIWGAVRLELQLDGAVIRLARAYTDAMDESALPRFAQALSGVGLSDAPGLAPSKDIADWLAEALPSAHS